MARSQREVVEAAVVEAVATVLHDHGPMDGQDEASDRWQDCPNGEIHGGVADKVASTMAVQALLDVVEAADVVSGYARHENGCDRTLALLRGQGLSQGGPGAPCNCGFKVDLQRYQEALARLPEEVRRG